MCCGYRQNWRNVCRNFRGKIWQFAHVAVVYTHRCHRYTAVHYIRWVIKWNSMLNWIQLHWRSSSLKRSCLPLIAHICRSVCLINAIDMYFRMTRHIHRDNHTRIQLRVAYLQLDQYPCWSNKYVLSDVNGPRIGSVRVGRQAVSCCLYVSAARTL
jgi:hypothetical protein